MTHQSDNFLGFLRPTPQKPLLGQTILAVEDSRCAGEALRLMSLRSGARFRRADCLRAASRHLSTYRPTVVICDVGLPDGSGLALIEELARARPPVAALIGISGDPASADAALAAGAERFITKPLSSLGEFQETLLSVIPPDQHPAGPRSLDSAAIQPGADSVTEDLAHVADLLSSAEDDGTADYIAAFIIGVGRVSDDAQLVSCADKLASQMRDRKPFGQSLAALSGLVQARLADRTGSG